MFSICLRLVFALSFLSHVLASPLTSRSPYAVRERHRLPRGWTRVGPAPPNRLVNLQISLKSDRFDELERHLYEGEWSSLLSFHF